MEKYRTEKPMLSVIVPIFNAEQHLEKCLDSIINQTFLDMEILLVNDGSTDGSLSICRKYQKKDCRIKVISKENGGLIRARKSGLSIANGRFIGFVDSDDWIEPQMYSILVTCMEETDCDLVSSGIIRDFEDGRPSEILFDHYEEGCYRDPEQCIYPTMLYSLQYKDFGIYCTLVNKLYKRELLERVYEHINDEVFYGEDVLTCYPYCLFSNSIYILHQVFYHYNIRGSSMASAPDARLPQNNYLLYQNLRAIFLKSDCAFILMRQLKKFLMNMERHNLMVLYQFDAVALDEWHFSVPEELFDKRFVIYGAGACGQALYRKICDMRKESNMVLWIDRNAENRTEECAYPISKPEVLLHADWDVILVSVKDVHLAEQIMQELSDIYCIEREKMFWDSIEHIPVWDIY